MNLPKPPGPLTWAGWAAAAIAVLAALLFIAWLVGAPGREAATAAKADAQGKFADGRTESGKAAAETTDRATKGAAADETLSRENADAIRAACPGPDCNRTALQRLCQREAYRNSPDCLQFARRPKPSG